MRSFEDLRDVIVAHGNEERPREACGAIVFSEETSDLEYVKCRNLATGTNTFIMDPDDLASAAALGELRAVVHTHVEGTVTPSPADRRGCYRSKLPYVIVGVPDGAMAVVKPEACEPAALLGRTYQYGVMDCYTLIQDFYAQELGIELPDFIREPEFWNKGQNMYLDNLPLHGFRQLTQGETPKVGDLALFTLLSAVPAHAAVFVAPDVILHHLPSRLSVRQPFIGIWQNTLYGIYRHRQME